jgi:hypothetical protein
MNKSLFLFAMLSCLTLSLFAQSQTEQAVKSAVEQFSSAADQSDASRLDKLLHPEFRIAMNRMFGSEELVLMPKALYLEKIRSQEFGGQPRTLVITDVQVMGTTASVSAVFKGSAMNFHSYLTLVQDATGRWQIVQDVPVVK